MLVLPLIVLLGCGDHGAEPGTSAPPAIAPLAPSGAAHPSASPPDVKVPTVTPTATVTNPANGDQLAVYVYTPPTGTAPWPALVVAPGGVEPALRSLPSNRQGAYLQTGFALVLFDPDGRGASTGTEDRGGAASQNGLAAVIDWAAHDSRVDPDRMGLMSLSYGITMASGVLANHQTPIRFLLDWEGPASRVYTAACGTVSPDRPRAPGWGECGDEAYWSQREAVNFIGRIKVPYQRVQFDRDHVQPTHQHAVDMVAAAEAGGVPWVRINDDEPNKKVTTEADFTPLPNARPQPLVLEHYAKALMEMTTGKPVVGDEPPMPERATGAGGRAGGPGVNPGRGSSRP